MTKPARAPPALDEGNICFQVRAGMRLISCEVADEALEAASGLALPSTSTTRRKPFDRFRTLIDAAAKLKLKELPADFGGLLVLSSRDRRRVVPETGLPSYGTALRGT